MIASSVLTRSVCPRADENELGTESGGRIGGSRIDDKMANLSNSTKKMSSESGFLTFKASLAFT